MSFRSGHRFSFSVLEDGATGVHFEKLDSPFPTRLVTGLRIEAAGDRLPCECSLGVTHSRFPEKHFHWGLICASTDIGSQILVDHVPFKGFGAAKKSPVTLKLYSAHHDWPLEKTLNSERDLKGKLTGLFPEALDFLKGEFGWFTLYSGDPRLAVYSLLSKKTGSVTLEHGF